MVASHTCTLFVSAPDAAKSGLTGLVVLLLVYPLQVPMVIRTDTMPLAVPVPLAV